MNPSDQNQPIQNPLAAMRPNEEAIFQLRRHPFGLLGIHIVAGMLLLVSAVVLFGVLPQTLTTIATSRVIGLGSIGFIIIAALVAGFLAITHKVYWGNSWILTSDSLTQVTQVSLFDKQSSQLSLGNLEDVTAEQNGIVAHMFNFGTIRVETAGERSKFFFAYCPNPTMYAQKIIQAREAFEQGKGETPAQASQQPPTQPPVNPAAVDRTV
jgi:hypothetical protein